MATNKAYWEQREKKHIEQLNKADDDYSSKLQGHYDETIKDINNDINEFYVKYANKEGISLAEAKKKVANEDVKAFQSTAKKMVKDKDFSPDANEKLRLYNATMRINRLEMLKAKIGLELTGMNTKQSASLKAKLTKEYQSEVERQAGILGENKLDNVAAKVDTVVNGSFYNATFSQRIWANQDSLKARIDKHLTDWLIRGDKPTDKLAKDLAKEMGVSFNMADRLMKTESSRISVEAEKNSLSEAGVKYYWIVGEADACDVCKELIRKSHTKPIKVDDATIGDNTPPIHARCRCTMSAASDDWEDWNQWLQDNSYSTSALWTGSKTSSKSKHGLFRKNTRKKKSSNVSIADERTFEDQMKNIGFDEVQTKGLDVDSMNKIYDTVSGFYNKYPQMKGFIRSFKTSNVTGDTVASAGFNSASLKRGDLKPELTIYTSKLANFDSILKESLDTHWWTKKKDYTGIINHEIAHLITKKITLADHNFDVKYFDSADPKNVTTWNRTVKDMNSHVTDELIMREAFKNAKIPYTKANIEKYISIYGKSTNGEAFAEAMSNEDKSNVITKYTRKIAERELSKLDPTTEKLKN